MVNGELNGMSLRENFSFSDPVRGAQELLMSPSGGEAFEMLLESILDVIQVLAWKGAPIFQETL